MNQRSSDRHLDADLVSRVIADQFPDLAGCEVRSLCAGWDNEPFSAGDDWIFRFPKRADRMPWLAREIEIMRTVSETLGSLVPRFERFGAPSAPFPYPFVGYRRVPGVGADRADLSDPPGLAKDIGVVFTRLHSIDSKRIPPTPTGWEHEPRSTRRTQLVAAADTVRPLLDEHLLRRAEPYLAGAVAEPARAGPKRFIHSDICPDHVLVDRHTGRLTGLIDFTDAMVGDPVDDFVGLVPIGGRGFANTAVAHYGLPLGDAFDSKLEWLSRVLTLTWLADAAAENAGAIDKHLAWVGRAFAE